MLDEEKKAIEMLRNYDNEDNLHKIHQSINVLLNLIEKQKKEIENLKEINKEHQKINGELRDEIEELKKDNNHQWEERCRLTFELQETEDRLSKIELQLLEEE